MGSFRKAVVPGLAFGLALAFMVFTYPNASETHTIQLEAPLGSGGFEGATLAVPLFEQLDACTGGAPSQDFVDFGSIVQVADDFTIPNGAEWVITQIVGRGTFQSQAGAMPVSEGDTYEIFDNGGPDGLPGALVCAGNPVNQGEEADPDLDFVLEFGDCDLEAGTYWMSLYRALAFQPNGDQWFWLRNDSSNGAVYAAKDPGNLLGTGCADWTEAELCGLDVSQQDLCFGVGTSGPEPDTGVVPAAGTTGVIVLIALLLGTSVFFLRRRQTT